MSQKKAQLLNPLSGNINVTGVVTASSFSGDGSALAGIAKTDNIQTATQATFLGDVSITGVTTVGVVTGGTSVSASYYYGDGSQLTGISVDSTSLKDDDGNIKVQANPNGAVVTGITTLNGNAVVTGITTFNGNVEIKRSDGSETIARFLQDSAVKLHFNGDEKFTTGSQGISITGNILPEANGTRDIGATGYRWANIYTSDLDLSNEARGGNDVDGTWGSYTIQEGENDLFLINRRTGKTYKFVLEEIN